MRNQYYYFDYFDLSKVWVERDQEIKFPSPNMITIFTFISVTRLFKYLKDTHREKPPKVNFERLRKIRIWTFGIWVLGTSN